MASETTRPSLISRLRDPKDEAAWRDFEGRYRDLIRRYARRQGLQEADAEDIGQLVLLSLSRSLRGFRYDPARGRFRNYLGRVVQNAIWTYRASPTRELRLLETSVLEDMSQSGEDPLEPAWHEEWTNHHVRLAMRKVRAVTSPESLAVFERLLTGESVDAVATALGMSSDAVYKVKQRVGERVRQEVEKQVRDEDVAET